MRPDIDPTTLLALWGAALGRPAGVRADVLLRAADADADADADTGAHAPSGRTLGQRNAGLVELHARLFGREIELLSHCPACATAAHFSGDCDTLAAQMRPPFDHPPPHRLQAHGYEIAFRLPADDDIAAASRDEADFVGLLLERCVLACTHAGEDVPSRQIPAPVLDALSQQMESLDPGARVSFALDCPQCATRWDAPLDVGEMVWQKVQAGAERVLLDIDVLARSYGWTEHEILRLDPLRRAAYLQMVTA